MLGNTALAQTPFATLGGGVIYTRYIQATATSSDSVAAIAAFSPRVVGTATATDIATVGPSIYNASVVETDQATDTSTALGEFNASAVDTANGSAIPTVDPSIFSATLSATASGADDVLAYAVFIAIASDGALGVDVVTRRLLWEIINDSQPENWTIVKTQS